MKTNDLIREGLSMQRDERAKLDKANAGLVGKWRVYIRANAARVEIMEMPMGAHAGAAMRKAVKLYGSEVGSVCRVI